MPSDEKLKAEVKVLLDGAQNRDAAGDALVFLFPKLSGSVDKPFSTEDYGNRSIDRRISKRQFARNYFTLTPDRTHPSKLQLQELMKAGPEPFFNRLSALISAVDEGQRMDVLNTWFDFLEGSLPESEIDYNHWFLSLLEFLSNLNIEIDWRREPIFGVTAAERIQFLTIGFLRKLSRFQRVSSMMFAIERASDISILCDVLRRTVGDIQPEGASQKDDFFDREAAEELREALLSRVRELAYQGGLAEQNTPAEILWFWWGSGHTDEVRAYTAMLMKTEEGLRVLFDMPISVVRSTGGNYERINRESWSKLLDLSQLEVLANEMTLKLNGPLKAEAERFLQALARDQDGF